MRIPMLCLPLLWALAASAAWAQDVVVDNDAGAPGFTTVGGWSLSVSAGWNGTTYVFAGSPGAPSTATWRPTLPATGNYEVFAAFLASGNRTPRAPYTIAFAGGSVVSEISQVGTGVREVSLGAYPFMAGTAGSVSLSNTGDPGAHIADAVIFRPVASADPIIGDIAHEPVYAYGGQALTLRCSVTPAVGASITSATATVVPQPGGTTLTLAMADDGAHNDGAAGDGVFAAQVPPQPGGTTVEFTLEAADNSGRTARPARGSIRVAEAPTAEWRAIWVDTWGPGILNPAQTQELVDTCRAANINTLIVEVRKVGDAYYNSSLEPRATNITGGPEYDPLAHLLQLAHDTTGGKRRLQVHCWFVSHRISRGEALAPNHILSTHPEYRMVRSDGTYETTNTFLDPGHPGTVDHNVAVILDCLSKYDIDGINLDYIRYPGGSSYGYNAVSVARFNALHGRTGQPAPTDPLWADWRRECVTLEVRKGYVKAWKMKPHVVYTTCCITSGQPPTAQTFHLSGAYTSTYQDWVRWLRDGIVDYSNVMNYTLQDAVADFRGWAEVSFAADDRRGSIIGSSTYRHTTLAGTMEQLLWVRHNGGGLNLFDWMGEVTANTEGATRARFYETLRTQVYPVWLDPPQPAWKHAPSKGIFEGTVTRHGLPVDHATVEVVGLDGSATVTDGSGWFGILEVPPGTHTLRVGKPGVATTETTASIPAAGDVVTVDVSLSASGVAGWQGF